MRILFLLILVSWMGIRCTSEEINEGGEVSMIFGTYAPRCIGGCTNLYKMSDGKLYKQLGQYRFLSDVKFDATPLTGTKYDLAKSVLSLMPEAISNASKPVGCPGCVDEAYLYFEFFPNEGNRSVNVDMQLSDLPNELHNWVSSCIEMIEKLD